MSVIRVLVVLLTFLTGVRACPTRCLCFRTTVRCMFLQLEHIPQVKPDTTVLDLRFNKIKHISSGTFKNLNRLTTLLLNNNEIEELQDGSFSGLNQVRYIYLYKNKIKSIEKDTFKDTAKLEQLYLHNNLLERLPKGIFSGLTNLRRLRLDSNAFICDCQMMWLSMMLKEKLSSMQAAATCQFPENLQGRSLMGISQDDFHCEGPHFVMEPRDVDVTFGNTAYFTCRAEGSPDPEIVWLHNENEIDVEQNERYSMLHDGTLMIQDTQGSDQGVYECIARNIAGEIRTNRVELRYFGEPERPRFVERPQDVAVVAGETVTLLCQVTGNPQPDISWRKDGNVIPPNGRYTIQPSGALKIIDVRELDRGVFTCNAANSIQTISSLARVTVQVPPTFTTPPEGVSAGLGDTVNFTCIASGDPSPIVTWSKDNRPLPNNGRYEIVNRGQVLRVHRTQSEDQGIYTCKTENIAGEVIASARLVIQSSVAPSFERRVRTVDTNTGIDLTLDCVADGDPDPSYRWNREGQHLITDSKFIVRGGQLIIRNIILGDTGRYDCIAENVAGRSTMSINLLVHADERDNLVRERVRNRPLNPGGNIQPTNFRPRFPPGRQLQDGRLTRLYERQRQNLVPRYTPIRSGHRDNRLTPRQIERAIYEATNRVNTRINDTIMDLFNRDRNHSVRDLLAIFRYPAPEALELARAEEIFEQTLEILHTHINQGHMYNLTGNEESYRELVSPAHLTLIANMSGCARRPIDIDCSNICFHRKYRTLNGICNNFKNPTWGAANQAFKRLLHPIYENGFNTPVGWNRGKMYNGIHLPSPRLISSFMMSTDHVTMDEQHSHMLMQWGQFIDHDMDLSPQSISFSRFSDGQRCNETCENVSPCFPISVPNSDQRIRSTCLGFTRTSATCNTGTTSVFFSTVAPRQQINALTAFIDASNVYGSSPDEANALRDLTNERGLLRVGPLLNGNRLLPFDDNTLHHVDCQLDATKRHVPCFKAGDHRSNEHVALTAMHTLWMREHNRIATVFEELNPHWDGNKIYHETRKIIGAVMQHITYDHWLPKILGDKGMSMMGDYKGYNPNVDPSIANEFATAAFRFGHSLVQPVIFRLNESYQQIPEGNLPLHKAFFSPYRILEEGGIDPLLRGLYGVAAKKRMPGELLNTELTEKLFSLANSVGQDLASLNIQRGRDHGIPFYTSYRKYCNLSAVASFEDLIMEIQDGDTVEKLRAVYSRVDNIDLFVGGMSETPAPGAKIGPTFLCIISDQFMRIRAGDRFWYENPGVFTPEQVDQIKQTSLARVICDNSDGIRSLQHDTFLFKTEEEMVSCENIPKLDLRMWTDCCEECRRNNFESFTRHFRNRNQFSFADSRPIARFGGRFHPPQTPVNTLLNSFQGDEPIQRNQPQPSLPQTDQSTEDIKDDMTALSSRLEGVESVMEAMSKTIKHLKKKVRFLQRQIKGGKQHNCLDTEEQVRKNGEKWKMDECKLCICKRGKVVCMSETCPKLSCESPVKKEGNCCPVCS